jgi:MFS family permease
MNQKFSLIGIIIWLVCAVFFMYEFLLRTVLGTFEHPIIHDLNLDLVTFAILSSTAYQMIYGVMQIPVGIITDKYGLKISLFIAVVVCSIAVAGFGFTHAFDSAFAFRLLMGFGSSFGFVCLLMAVYDWMPRKNIGLFIGLSQFIGTMGPMIAAGPLNSLSNNSSAEWRYVFYVLGVVGIAIAILVLLIVKNNKESLANFQILRRPSAPGSSLKKLFSQKQVWFIAVYSAAIYFTIEYLSENSGTKYMVLHGYTKDIASYMITIAWLGYGIGCPLLGFISDLTSRRKNTMIFAAFSAIIAAIVIIYFPVNIVITMAAFFFLGVGASGQSIGFAIMAERCNNSYLAAGLGLNNGMIMLVTSINAPIIGWLISFFTDGGTTSIADFQQAFIYIIAFIGIAVFLSIFCINETFCKSTKEITQLSY